MLVQWSSTLQFISLNVFFFKRKNGFFRKFVWFSQLLSLIEYSPKKEIFFDKRILAGCKREVSCAHLWRTWYHVLMSSQEFLIRVVGLGSRAPETWKGRRCCLSEKSG
jgi:hypothetical protein